MNLKNNEPKISFDYDGNIIPSGKEHTGCLFIAIYSAIIVIIVIILLII